MAKLRAVVLAAGRGVRMGGEMPKTLIPVGEHEPLLHYILAGLRGAGIEDLVVVTGFKPEDVEAYVTKEWGEATFLRNYRYSSWGNFHSVRVAIDQSPGAELLVVNSDIVVNPDVYTRVLRSDGDLVLAVQKRYRLDDEDMRVHVQGDRMLGVSKQMPRARSHGEYCGVSLLRGTAPDLYAEIATEFEWTRRTQMYYEDVYHEMASRVDARAAFVDAGEYAEVDLPSDMEAAVSVVERFGAAFQQPASA